MLAPDSGEDVVAVAVIPEIIVRVVVPLGYGRVRVDVRVGGDDEGVISTAEVWEVAAGVVEDTGKVEISEHPAQIVIVVVAQSLPQVVTVVVTVLACSCFGRALTSEGLY